MSEGWPAERRALPSPAEPEPGEALKVHLSIPVTRRKQFHYVTGQEDRVLLVTMNSAHVFDWLYENDVKDFLVEAEKYQYRLSVHRPTK